MRCFITGVAGFVGSHLAERLLADGHEVCGLDAFTNYYPRAFKERNLEGPRAWQRFRFVEADIHTADLPELLEGVDWVFHQAAQAGVRTSWGAEFDQYVDRNLLATFRLLEAARHSGNVKRFVYASSSSVYGDTTILPVHESASLHPASPYGITKLAAEQLCTLYHRNFGLPTVSLRYFTVYGPRQRPDMAFHRFCTSMLERRPIVIYGDGEQTRDFTYISDVIEANILAAASEQTTGETMNIAGGARASLHDVIQLLQEIGEVPVTVDFAAHQPGDVIHTFADIGRARRLIGYRPGVALREGLAQQFEYISRYHRPLFID
jgi:nucleoside-diphosphate-sugar epimerase